MKKSPAATRSKNETPVYKNPKVTSAKRTQDLLARMTLEEKAAQMLCIWQQKADTLVDAKGDFDLQKRKRPFAIAVAWDRSAGPAMRAAARARVAWRS